MYTDVKYEIFLNDPVQQVCSEMPPAPADLIVCTSAFIVWLYSTSAADQMHAATPKQPPGQTSHPDSESLQCDMRGPEDPCLKRAAVIGGSTWIPHSWRSRVSVHRLISLQRAAQRWLGAVKVRAGSGVERTLSCDVSIVPSSQGLRTVHPSVCLTDLCHFTVSVQLEASHQLITLCGLITWHYKAQH